MDEDAAPLSVDLRALVSDLETDDADLTYTIESGPTAAQGTFDPDALDNGVFSFDSTLNFNGSVTITYSVTDRGDPDNCGAPGLGCDGAETSEIRTITITVNPVNDAPVISGVPAPDPIPEGVVYSFDADATDVDNAPADMHFTLEAGAGSIPSGATIDEVTGQFSWNPAEDQGPGTYTFDVCVDDQETPPLEDCDTITISVFVVNLAPVLGEIANEAFLVDRGLLTFDAESTDPDVPVNTLTYSLQAGRPAPCPRRHDQRDERYFQLDAGRQYDGEVRRLRDG